MQTCTSDKSHRSRDLVLFSGVERALTACHLLFVWEFRCLRHDSMYTQNSVSANIHTDAV
jgi:hypothetical protein